MRLFGVKLEKLRFVLGCAFALFEHKGAREVIFLFFVILVRLSLPVEHRFILLPFLPHALDLLAEIQPFGFDKHIFFIFQKELVKLFERLFFVD